MANYNIIIDNSHFKPFSYKDIIAPYDDYAKDYDAETERIHKFIDDYGNLNLPTGSNAYQEYQNAIDQQNKALESFYSQGLNQNTQKELFKAFTFNKGRLSKMKAAAAQVDKMRDAITALGQDTIIGTEIDNPHLIDDILDGKNPTLKHVDRTKVFTLGQQIGRGLQTSMTDYNVSTFTEALKNQYYQATIGKLDYNKILDATLSKLSDEVIEGAQNNPAVQALIKAYNSYGNDFSASGQQQIWDTIGLGVMSGLEPPKQQFMQDRSVEQRIALENLAMERGKYHANYNDPNFTGGADVTIKEDSPLRNSGQKGNSDSKKGLQKSRYIKIKGGKGTEVEYGTGLIITNSNYPKLYAVLCNRLSCSGYPINLIETGEGKKATESLVKTAADALDDVSNETIGDYTQGKVSSLGTRADRDVNNLIANINSQGYILDLSESVDSQKSRKISTKTEEIGQGT